MKSMGDLIRAIAHAAQRRAFGHGEAGLELQLNAVQKVLARHAGARI